MLAAPAGARTVMGLDPGLRTGTKLVVIDPTGKLLDSATIFPVPPHKRLEEALESLGSLCRQHEVELIAIGNGTASREIDQFVGHALKHLGLRSIQKLVVSEAGASGVLGVRTGGERVSGLGCQPARGSLNRSPVAGTRWPNWSRSSRKRLGLASTSTM